MSVSVHNGTAHADTWPSINVSGTFKDAQSTTDGVVAVYNNIAGTYRMSWPLVDSIADFLSRDITLGTATTYVVLQIDGRIRTYGTTTASSYINFADNAPDTDKGGAAPTLFQYKWEANPDTPDVTPVAVSTWTDLTANATWSETRVAAGTDTKIITMHLRAKDTPASTISVDVTLTAFNTI